MSLVMFDYDGVIADSLENHVNSLLTAFQEYGFDKVKTKQDVMDLYEDNVYQSMMDIGLSEKDIDTILANYDTKQEIVLENIPFFPEIPELFQELSLKHQVYIITSNTAEVVQGMLDKNGITGVKRIMGLETAKSKIKKINLAKAEHPDLKSYYVGDTTGDIYEGQKAGVSTVGVAWGWHGEEKLKESSPDYIINTPLELLIILN